MQKRSPIAVPVLAFVTLGIYCLVWYAKTASDFHGRGAEIPHWILLLIPLANIYWIVKWAQGVRKATNDGMSALLAFLLLVLLGPIGMAVVQSTLNKHA